MTVGLDLSGSRFRSLRRQGSRLVARACRSVYAVVLDSPARRALFAAQHVPFAEFGSNLILFGDAAEEWSTRLRVSAIPLVVNGRLQLDDAVIRQVITALIEGLLPVPELRETDCCLTLPGGLDQTAPAAVEFVAHVVRNFGYIPRIASGSLAVGLSELSLFGVSGLGIHLGENRCEFSVLRQGLELTRFEIPGGLGPAMSAASAESKAADAETLLREIFATAAFELNRRAEWKALAPPVAVAISGELTAFPGLAERIPISMQHASWPFAVRTIPIATECEWTVCRGCLIQAELEQLAQLSRPAA